MQRHQLVGLEQLIKNSLSRLTDRKQMTDNTKMIIFKEFCSIRGIINILFNFKKIRPPENKNKNTVRPGVYFTPDLKYKLPLFKTCLIGGEIINTHTTKRPGLLVHC